MRMVAFLKIFRLVKGGSDQAILPFSFIAPYRFLGYAGITTSQFGMFFLRKLKGTEYSILNPYYPFLVATVETPVAKASDLEKVIAEVAQVLVLPKSSLGERLRAVDVLAVVKTLSAKRALRIVVGGQNQTLRLKAAAALLRQNDISVLTTIEDELLAPKQNIEAGLLRELAFAIQDGIKAHEAIPILKRLLQARNVQTRRAAAAALRHTGTNEAIEPLSNALKDDDREVRYQAVLGLAIITGQSEWGPSIDQFERDEQHYLTYWREWVRDRK